MSDCQDLEDFLDRMDYQERELDIYPGFPHGFLEFASRDSAKRFMDKLPKAELDGLQDKPRGASHVFHLQLEHCHLFDAASGANLLL